jgi:competence protein ComEA
MFSPNRLLTPKEQALLLGVALAVLLGSGAIYWSARRGAPATVAAVSIDKPPPAPAKQPVTPPRPEPPAAAPAATPAPIMAAPPPAPERPAEIAVAVRGGVQRQGLFRLPPDSRVADLIMKAGGATTEADLSEINLAAKLMDGTTLTVPVGARLTKEDGRISGRGGQHHAAANPAAYLAGMATPDATGPTPGQSVAAAARQAAPTAADTAAPAVRSKGAATASGGMINLNTATQAELESLPGIGKVLAGSIIAQREAQPFASVDELDNVPGIGAKKLEAVRNLVTVE